MLCERCGKHQATTILTQTINGVSKTEHICSECAYKSGINDFFGGFSLGSFINSLGGVQNYSEKRCPKCGSSFDEIRENGKIGCASCYSFFKDELLPTISNIHGKALHVGKTPHGFIKRIEEKSETPKPQKEISEIEKLRLELQKAIESQEFEKAASLRDKIKELEAKQ